MDEKKNASYFHKELGQLRSRYHGLKCPRNFVLDVDAALTESAVFFYSTKTRWTTMARKRSYEFCVRQPARKPTICKSESSEPCN